MRFYRGFGMAVYVTNGVGYSDILVWYSLIYLGGACAFYLAARKIRRFDAEHQEEADRIIDAQEAAARERREARRAEIDANPSWIRRFLRRWHKQVILVLVFGFFFVRRLLDFM